MLEKIQRIPHTLRDIRHHNQNYSLNINYTLVDVIISQLEHQVPKE